MKETVDTTNNIVQPIPSGTNRPLWSVMIPTFNPGIYFIDAVNSAISQNIGPELMQIDIVDDCSTKVDIPKIIEENWKGRVGYHRLPKNVGHSFNFTESVRRAKGELVHLLHDDDLVKPGFYSKFENIFNKYENIGAAFCRQEYIDDDGKFMFYSELEMEEMGILDDALVKLAQKQRIQYCAMVIRRNAFEQIGGFVTKNIGCEDWEMWVRIASRFPIAYEPEALAQYRIHRKSMTLTDMRSGQDMRFLREAADIFTQYLPEEKRKEVTLFRNKHYAAYSLSNAKRMFEEFNDEEGAVAQLSETIKLNSEIVYENLDFLEKLTKPIEQAGVSVVVNCQNNKDLIDITLRSLSNQKVSKFIPWEIIFVVDSASDSCTKIALDSWAKYRSKTPLRILTLKNISQFESRKITIEDSKYNFVVFCNPGNLLNLDYIDNVSKKMMEDISTGAMGGYSEGQSSSMFPIWFDQRNNNSYQSGEQFEYPGDITWSKGYLWSAGLVIRKEAWITLMEKNFVSISNYESSADDYSVIDREICYVLRSSGWKIKYLFDLKLKNFIQPGELNWRHLRKSYFQRGKDSVNLIPYKKSANKNVKDFKELHKRVDYRRLVTITCRKLQSYKGWKLNSYSENLEGDKDILSIEYYAGKLNFLLDKYNSYNDKVRILKRTVPKKLHRFYKYTIRDVHFSYPKYKINNSLNGISIFLTHGSSSSYNLLQQALEKISLQQLPKDFPFEVTVVSNFIEKDIQGKLKEIWKNENQVSRLNIEILRILTHEKVRKLAAEKSRYEFLIFLNEADLLKPDYVRIAYKVLHERADFNLIGGRTSLARDVKPPKWFNSNKSFFGVGSPADESGDITNQNHPLLNAPVILRKKVLYNIYKEDLNSDQNEIASGYLDLNLTTKIKLYGGKIFYEKRLRSEKYIPVKFFDWSYLKEMHRNTGRLEVKESVYSHLFDGNNSNGNSGLLWIKKANNALGQINKYPLNKIFADKHEFAGDSEVLEIEKLKGKFSELLTSREKYHTFTNGNGKQIDEKVLLHINSNGNNNSKELKKGVSIVLCCYNSSKILPITLKYIFRQNIPKDIPWEIIIVDNASTDQTSETARNVYNTFNCLAPFTIVNEPKPGLSEARQRGFSTAKYEYVLFCDDDNLLEKNYVKYVYEVMNANKRIGVLGGQSIAEFDTSPQKWFEDWKSSFAIGKQFETDGDITWKRGYVWGASMVVRKEAWEKLRSKGFKTLLTDRKGKTLSAGGDTEICYALRNDGWKIWYDSRLKFKHHISLERLNWMYLRKLVRGFGQASAGLDFYLKNLPEKYSLKKRTKLNSKRIEIHKTLSTLRSIRHEKLLSFNRKREGDSDLPMIEYCLGRIEGLIKTRKTYNRGLKLLKRAVRKKDFIYISYAFKDYNINFPRYNVIKKLNGVSVIVCTYNGAERLAETIKKIAEQKVKANILWEVILVDNASTDDSKEITINEWKKYKTNAKLKIVDQPIPGKQLALEKGYEVAQYEYLITCDDDNWLDENFVQLTYEIMSSNEKIGALGGPNDPVCEIEPPEWFTYFKRDYAAGPQPDVHTGKISEGNITWKRGYVWGAGMIVRKSAWQQLFKDGFKTSMSCRKGSELSSGGDSEACYALVLAGWQIWYDSRLKLKHCMPAGRLDWNYLLRLFVGFGTATVGLEAYEKAIRLARADISESEILKQNWWYEFKKAITEIKKFGIKKILSLRFAQDNNTNILMLEFYISKLKELIRVRKDYDKSLESVRIASWKKDFSQLKADHRKYLEEQNDFRYGWPWINETEILPAPAKPYPKISILSPSFNSVGTIEKAILSVLNQGYPEFEHVICDAGSTDGTIEILKKYPHLKWVSEPDKGQSDAMNKAFRMSDGNIIAYLNVDDYFQRNAFYKIADAFEKDNSSDMVIGNLFFEYADHTFARVPDIEYKKIMLPFKYMFPINPVSYFYKREVQEKIGPFPIENHMTMDYWFLLKAYQNFKLQQIDAYLGTFCMNGYNKTSNANNRKNTHHRVLYHCWNFDRKNLPYYLYNYYKHFYYDQKPWNPGRIGNKIKKNLRRIHSILTLKKNKYYSQILFEKSRNRYFEKKRIRSIINILNSFIIYPKSLLYRSRQSQLIYSLLGADYSEKAKSAYFFLTTPPGLPLANKLHYYGNEFKNNNKIIKGNALLLLTYIISPKFIFKNKRTSSKKIKETFAVKPVSEFAPKNTLRKTIGFLRNKEYRETSYNLFNQAGERLYFHKNLQASILMFMSFIVSPSSIKKRSRRNLLTYSLLGDTITEKLKFAYHLYKDNPEYSLAHKLNYYGNELRKEYSTVKGNMILILAYVLSPKYISKREKVGKSNIVYASTQYVIPKKKISYKPKVIISNTANIFRDIRHSRDPAIMLKNFYLRSEYTVKSLFHYFKYRKYKAQSKELYTKAIESYNADRRMKVLTLILPSYILYPKSIINKNKFSLLVNSLLGKKMLRRLRRKG